MSIVYHGDVERVSRELAEVKEALDNQYRKVLGEERARRLGEVSARVLDRRSFYSDKTKLSKAFGINVEGANKFAIVSGKTFEIEGSGRLKERKINTAPLFYISEEGFQNSHSATFTERRIASYVHEYDHFVWYALQRAPIYLISMGIMTNLYPESGNVSPTPEGVITMLETLEKRNASRYEIVNSLGLTAFALFLHDHYEKANRLLDRQILQGIGINVDLPWRGHEKKYAVIPTPYEVVIAFPVSGDPFCGVDDAQAVENFLGWDERRMSAATPYIQNFMQSVRELKVSRVPFTQMRESRKGR